MTFRTFRVMAMAATFVAAGALAAQAASDDEIKYRDGKPVQGSGASAGGEAGMAKPMKSKTGKSGHKKSHKGKKMKHAT